MEQEKTSFLGKIELKPKPQIRERAALAFNMGMIGTNEYVKTALSVEPALDMATDTDPAVRQFTTEILATRGDQRAVEQLWEMMDDQNEEVRLYAAEALDIIDEKFHHKIEKVENSLHDEPDSTILHKELAITYYRFAEIKKHAAAIQNYYSDKAINEFTTVLTHSPGNPDIIFQRALCYQLKGELETAVSEFIETTKLAPRHPHALFQLATIYYQWQQYDKVIEQCKQIITIGEEKELVEIALFWTGTD